MKIRWVSFNIYLIATVLLLGCKTPQQKKEAAESRRQKKELSTIRFHLEAGGDASGRAERVTILRSAPISINVLKESFLDERDVLHASLGEHMGSFLIKIQFDDHGTFVLDALSAANKGKRVAIMSQFSEGRWLAAPVLSRRITDGVLSFTPDATREEAERIVRGLNNASDRLRNKSLMRNIW